MPSHGQRPLDALCNTLLLIAVGSRSLAHPEVLTSTALLGPELTVLRREEREGSRDALTHLVAHGRGGSVGDLDPQKHDEGAHDRRETSEQPSQPPPARCGLNEVRRLHYESLVLHLREGGA